MSNLLLLINLLLILMKIIIPMQAFSRCDFGECNHEGECYEENNERWCSCIGEKYFAGPKCSEAVDNCQIENPCQNGGKCRNVVGQFICEDCDFGFGGLWCDLEVSNVFEKLLLYFDHYAYYGQEHKFIIMAESLGEKGFSLEFVGENYAVASFESVPEMMNKWIYSEDLVKTIELLGIRYYQDLPYTQGYYHIAAETFWNVGLLELTLRLYDSESASQLLYQNSFSLLLLAHNDECVPDVRFYYGTNPLEPLMLDIASYNNFEIVLKNRCFPNSKIIYYWSIYNSIGTVKLHDFGLTTELILKIAPYTLWFNYHDQVAYSYVIVARMVEEYENYKKETQTRCFILVLPKIIHANIKGGNFREIGMKQSLILDATNSRDFALDPNVIQDFFYTWNCFSEDDVENLYCQQKMGSSSIMKITPGKLQLHNKYNFTLSIKSKVNEFVDDHTHQEVNIVENFQLNVDIKCLRNCLCNRFVQGDLMHLKAVPFYENFSQQVTFKWILSDQVVEETSNLIYKTNENDYNLSIQLVVQDQNLSATASQMFNVNLPPENGSCYIEPIAGQAFLTDFHIKCEKYVDRDMPLNYEYLTESEFPLQRTNEPEIYTKLPQCSLIVIKICDQFQACVENNLKVNVGELEEIPDLKKFLQEQAGGLANILERGEILTAMIMLKSVWKFCKTIADADSISQEMEKFSFKTLLQAEQFLDITYNLVLQNLPLASEKAYVFNKYFMKLNESLWMLVKDAEIKAFKKRPYEKTFEELLQIMQLFAQTWENIPAAHTPIRATILSTNPLIEPKFELPDFDINIAQQLENWLLASQTMQDCLDLMSEGAKQLYASWEDLFTLDNNQISFKMYAFETSNQQDIQLNGEAINIILNEACVKQLQEQLHSSEILIQAASLDSNPFWWYPSETPLNSQVFLLTAFAKSNSKSLHYLENPFEFRMEIKANSSAHNEVLGRIQHNLHMPVYAIELPANCFLVTTFLTTDTPVKFLIKILKPPTSLEVHNFGYVVKPANVNQSFSFYNPFGKISQAYMAVLVDAQYANSTFMFRSEIGQCLQWDFSLKDPQWSAQSCKPKVEAFNNIQISCFCHHFSVFTARTYQASIQEDLRKRWLLTELNLSAQVIGFYLGLLSLAACILLLNIYQYNNYQEYLPVSTSQAAINDVEVCIFTGSNFNASSTANISLSFTSEKSIFSLVIHQNPSSPFLKRNSVNRLLISCQQIGRPAKLTITNDQSGRYPSWFCHEIMVTNLKSRQKQYFLIDQWICQTPLEISETNKQDSNFAKRFCQHLYLVYINWSQFEALWGCWYFNDLNRLERCCLELSGLISGVCLLACYFGCTTLETYEEERDLYNHLQFNTGQLLLLSTIYYALSFFIKFIFHITMCLHHQIFIKQRKMSKKIV